MLSRNKVVLTEVGAGVKNPSLKGKAIVFETKYIGSSPMGYRIKWECSITGRTFVLHTKDMGSSPIISTWLA